jgi:hypothetical protein
MGVISRNQLTAYPGKPISQICPSGFFSDNDNHCAHFGAHALGYGVNVTCRTMSHGTLVLLDSFLPAEGSEAT